MAEEHGAQRQERPVFWTKIFTTFKIALDAKKLVLAAAGIFCTAAGWFVLAWLFYATRNMPEWGKNFEEGNEKEQREVQWPRFKAALSHWNLLHELAGDPRSRVLKTPADLAESLDEYRALKDVDEWLRTK